MIRTATGRWGSRLWTLADSRRGRTALVALVAALVAVSVVLVAGWPDRESAAGEPDRPDATAPAGPLSFTVDRALRPSVTEVEPVDGRGEARPVGVLAHPGGGTAELVRDELIVHVRDGAELAGFLARWDGEVLDSFPADDDGQGHLVRVDAGRADPDRLVDDLLAVEPEQAGGYRVSDEAVLRLLALAAAEWRAGTEVVVDWLVEPAGIADGEVYESSDLTKNVFDWSFMRVGGELDTGVAAAWRLLEAHGKLEPQVRYLVGDRGFSSNFDFPDDAKLRKTEWGKQNTQKCSGGTPCPYHGTDVVLAAMGKVDNQYGTAGPAGPVVSRLIAVGIPVDYWGKMRRLEDMAEQEHPDVVNLSYTRDVYVGSKHTKTWTDRRMRHVQRTGALIVASAGNNGRTVDGDRLWVPCESTYVMCVGGVDSDATRHPQSNFGQGDSSTSVEIYGPMCVRSINDPNRSALDYTTRLVCGTSFASPFVGGVAALVMAADPALGPEEVRGILNDTANVGGLGSEVTGSQRRVNALQAVARVLAVDVAPPRVAIDAPDDGDEVGVEDWVDLRGTAVDLTGRELSIHWESDADGALADGAVTSVPPLSLGTHVITATATDIEGRTGTDTVTIEVVDTPPDVTVVSPPAGLEVLEGSDVALVATSVDPDTWSAVPDGDAGWTVSRGGTAVHTATGHQATLPAAKVTPGDYTVRFTAGGSAAEVAFTVAAVPPGQTKPEAFIGAPEAGATFYNEAAKTITFAGSGTDAEDGAVPATRYRWVAYRGSEVRVLCEGSNVPGGEPSGGPVLAQPTGCGSFTAELELLGPPATTWSVWLEVYDSTGLKGTTSVEVTAATAVG
jgi:hypothetical protein